MADKYYGLKRGGHWLTVDDDAHSAGDTSFGKILFYPSKKIAEVHCEILNHTAVQTGHMNTKYTVEEF